MFARRSSWKVAEKGGTGGASPKSPPPSPAKTSVLLRTLAADDDSQQSRGATDASSEETLTTTTAASLEEEEGLRAHILRTRARIESLVAERPRLQLLLANPQQSRESMGISSAPSTAQHGRRHIPPCMRCGTNDYVVPFHLEGAWICCSVDMVDEATDLPRYCGETWHQDVPPLICPKRSCRGGARYLEYHFGELGFACRACGRFETLADLALPLSAPSRLGNGSGSVRDDVSPSGAKPASVRTTQQEKKDAEKLKKEKKKKLFKRESKARGPSSTVDIRPARVAHTVATRPSIVSPLDFDMTKPGQ